MDAVCSTSLLLALISCALALCVFGCEGDFSLTCSNEELQGASTLQALCGDGQGGYDNTALNLDEHISNSNGALVCNSGTGDFSASCRSISLTASNVLAANCFDVAGNLMQAQVDLDQCVENTYGQLTWDCL